MLDVVDDDVVLVIDHLNREPPTVFREIEHAVNALFDREELGVVLPVDPGEPRDRDIASRHVDEQTSRRYRELNTRPDRPNTR